MEISCARYSIFTWGLIDAMLSVPCFVCGTGTPRSRDTSTCAMPVEHIICASCSQKKGKRTFFLFEKILCPLCVFSFVMSWRFDTVTKEWIKEYPSFVCGTGTPRSRDASTCAMFAEHVVCASCFQKKGKGTFFLSEKTLCTFCVSSLVMSRPLDKATSEWMKKHSKIDLITTEQYQKQKILFASYVHNLYQDILTSCMHNLSKDIVLENPSEGEFYNSDSVKYNLRKAILVNSIFEGRFHKFGSKEDAKFVKKCLEIAVNCYSQMIEQMESNEGNVKNILRNNKPTVYIAPKTSDIMQFFKTTNIQPVEVSSREHIGLTYEHLQALYDFKVRLEKIIEECDEIIGFCAAYQY